MNNKEKRETDLRLSSRDYVVGNLEEVLTARVEHLYELTHTEEQLRNGELMNAEQREEFRHHLLYVKEYIDAIETVYSADILVNG